MLYTAAGTGREGRRIESTSVQAGCGAELMAYRFKRREHVGCGLRRIVDEQIDTALAEIDGTDGYEDLSRTEVVHQVRKRCKKIRAALRLCRPEIEQTYTYENTWFRDAARLLSGVRDAAAMIEAFDALMERYRKQVHPKQFTEVRALLKSARGQSDADRDIEQHIAEFRQRLVDAQQRLDSWTIETGGYDAVAGGLKKAYSRGRDARNTARKQTTTANLHEWRKRVKDHGYHCRMLRDIWTEHMDQRCDALSDLSDLLGDDHDLAVMRDTIVECGGPVAAHDGLDEFIELLDSRRVELQRDAFALGRLVYAEKPKRLRKRFEKYWKAWRSRRDDEPTTVEQRGAGDAHHTAPAR